MKNSTKVALGIGGAIALLLTWRTVSAYSNLSAALEPSNQPNVHRFAVGSRVEWTSLADGQIKRGTIKKILPQSTYEIAADDGAVSFVSDSLLRSG